MEQVNIKFDDFLFDTIVHAPNAIPDDGNPQFIFKDHVTMSGNPGAVIAFNAKTKDGKTVQCQTVVTARLLLMVAAAIKGRYPELDK
jgi:hypothetical protein